MNVRARSNEQKASLHRDLRGWRSAIILENFGKDRTRRPKRPGPNQSLPSELVTIALVIIVAIIVMVAFRIMPAVFAANVMAVNPMMPVG